MWKPSPGIRWWTHLWWYSNPLMTRNVVPSVIVAASQPAICLARPSCAARTARTIVSELPMRTIVFRSPERDVELVRPEREVRRVLPAVDRVGEEEPAEEHDLLGDEEPHPQRRGLALLVVVVEVVGEGGPAASQTPTVTSLAGAEVS